MGGSLLLYHSPARPFDHECPPFNHFARFSSRGRLQNCRRRFGSEQWAATRSARTSRGFYFSSLSGIPIAARARDKWRPDALRRISHDRLVSVENNFYNKETVTRVSRCQTMVGSRDTTLENTSRANCPNTNSLSTAVIRDGINGRDCNGVRLIIAENCLLDPTAVDAITPERRFCRTREKKQRKKEREREREISSRSRNDARDKSTAINLSWIPFRVVRASQPASTRQLGRVYCLVRSRQWPFTRCNYVRPGGRSSNPQTKIDPVRNDPQLRKLLQPPYFYFSPPTALPLHPRSLASRASRAYRPEMSSGLQVRRLASIITWSIR